MSSEAEPSLCPLVGGLRSCPLRDRIPLLCSGAQDTHDTRQDLDPSKPQPADPQQSAQTVSPKRQEPPALWWSSDHIPSGAVPCSPWWTAQTSSPQRQNPQFVPSVTRPRVFEVSGHSSSCLWSGAGPRSGIDSCGQGKNSWDRGHSKKPRLSNRGTPKMHWAALHPSACDTGKGTCSSLCLPPHIT